MQPSGRCNSFRTRRPELNGLFFFPQKAYRVPNNKCCPRSSSQSNREQQSPAVFSLLPRSTLLSRSTLLPRSSWEGCSLRNGRSCAERPLSRWTSHIKTVRRDSSFTTNACCRGLPTESGDSGSSSRSAVLCDEPLDMWECRHFVNLTNGIEALPMLHELGLSYSFVRIQSTACEQQNLEALMNELDPNLLISLALGYTCLVYDCGSRGRDGTPRALWYGLEFVRYTLSKLWLRQPCPALLRGRNVSRHFDEQIRAFRQSTTRRLKYYTKYLPPGTGDEAGGPGGVDGGGLQRLRLYGVYRPTDHDDDVSYFVHLLYQYQLPQQAAASFAADEAPVSQQMGVGPAPHLSQPPSAQAAQRRVQLLGQQELPSAGSDQPMQPPEHRATRPGQPEAKQLWRPTVAVAIAGAAAADAVAGWSCPQAGLDSAPAWYAAEESEEDDNAVGVADAWVSCCTDTHDYAAAAVDAASAVDDVRVAAGRLPGEEAESVGISGLGRGPERDGAMTGQGPTADGDGEAVLSAYGFRLFRRGLSPAEWSARAAEAAAGSTSGPSGHEALH